MSFNIDNAKLRMLSTISSLRQFNINTSSIDSSVVTDLTKFSDYGWALTKSDSWSEQNDTLDNLANSEFLNSDYALEIKPLTLRNDNEKRLISLLSHFIKECKLNNKGIYNNLKVIYSSGDAKQWDKSLVNDIGCTLSGKNPKNFYKFISSISQISNDHGLTLGEAFPPPKGFLSAPSTDITDEKNLELKVEIEQRKEFWDNLDKDNLLEVLEIISIKADLLIAKQSSIKLRQENLMSLYIGNPNPEVKSMLLGTNAMNIELRGEQQSLASLSCEAADALDMYPVAGGSTQIEEIGSKIKGFTLQHDNELSFVIYAEKLEERVAAHEFKLKGTV